MNKNFYFVLIIGLTLFIVNISCKKGFTKINKSDQDTINNFTDKYDFLLTKFDYNDKTSDKILEKMNYKFLEEFIDELTDIYKLYGKANKIKKINNLKKNINYDKMKTIITQKNQELFKQINMYKILYKKRFYNIVYKIYFHDDTIVLSNDFSPSINDFFYKIFLFIYNQKKDLNSQIEVEKKNYEALLSGIDFSNQDKEELFDKIDSIEREYKNTIITLKQKRQQIIQKGYNKICQDYFDLVTNYFLELRIYRVCTRLFKENKNILEKNILEEEIK